MRIVRASVLALLVTAGSAQAEPPVPLLSEADVERLADTQKKIAVTKAEAELAEAEARRNKAQRERDTQGEAAAAKPAGTPSASASTHGGTAAPARASRSVEDPVVARISRAWPDGPLVATLIIGTTTVMARRGMALPGGLRVIELTADAVSVAGADDLPRSLVFGGMKR
jgi:type IV pilus biogenesis protein PilP